MMRHCDSCRAAPGHVYCRADAAVLCVSCDADIHSANLISHRHHRVPVMFVGAHDEVYVDDKEVGANGRCDYEALFGEEVDEYLDLGEFGVCDESNNQGQKQGMNLERVKSEGSEGVVPVVGNEDYQDINYTAQPSHRVPLSSIEVNSVVHHHTTVTEIADAYIGPSKGTIELFSAPVPLQLPTHFSHTDREARVLRYREKKKTRKFEKTIRYASRKAYAEARPRIKGRFAKRSEVELEVDQMFSNYVDVSEDGYGIVPSF